MKVKALFVAPYAAMKNLIEECRREETELDLEIKIGNLQEGVAFAKKAAAEGVEVIISRGGTAKLIGEAVDIPVIDVHVSGYDMLRVLTLANNFPKKKAIVGFSAITLGAKAIIDLLDISIDIFTIDNEYETEPLVQRLKQEGYELIMGDVVTIDTVSRLGLLGILIQSGREAIFDAFKEAKTVSRWMMKNKLENEQLKAILQVTASDFIVLSPQGSVVYEQWKTFRNRPIADFQVLLGQHDKGNKETIRVIDHEGGALKLVTTRIAIQNAFYLICEVSKLKQNPDMMGNLKISVLSPPQVIHKSKAMNSCLTVINRCLANTYFILIGKSGTGKEVVAQYIHYHKHQGDGLYASVSGCDLLDLNPEIMDHDIKTIYVHAAEQLEDSGREKLLRKMEILKKSGITIILALLDDEPFSGDMIFAEDTIRIHIPTLAERKEDISELVTSFIAYFHQTLGTSAIKIKEESLALLEAYHWPGNVEELRAILKDAVLMEKGYVIEKKIIESLLKHKKSEDVQHPSDLLTGTLEDIEKKIIEHVLAEENFNQTKAAKRLNINRSTLWRKLKE